VPLWFLERRVDNRTVSKPQLDFPQDYNREYRLPSALSAIFIGGNLSIREPADHLRLVFFSRCPLVVRPKCFKTAAKGFRLNFK